MPKQILIPALLLLSPVFTWAQASYDAGLIPDSLKTHSHVVEREMDESFTVFSPSKATYKVHEVRTVLDPAGKGSLVFVQYSSSFSKLQEADINVFDAKGQPLQHIRQKDMQISGYGEGLVDDGKVTYFYVTAPSYPITVQMDYTVDYKGLLGYPSFNLDNVDRSIQHMQYVLTVPAAMGVRYKNHLTNLQPVTEAGQKDVRVYTWKAEGICAVREENSVLSNSSPEVMIAPTQFEMQDHPGDMSTWEQFGAWLYDLNKETYVLPDASKAFYRDMVAGATTDRDKARIIYNYLQKNFRYVSIQLGIGGWRSFPASFTENRKYGDCKGLSTYMKACLEAVGVKSYTADINAGPNQAPADPTFPINRFNHQILCIPEAGDSIWLECTSNRADFGVLGNFTEDRNALLVTENGGKLVRTPTSKAQENTSTTFAQIDLADDGSGKAVVSILSSGVYKFNRVNSLYEQNHDDQRKYLVDAMHFLPPDDFSVTLQKIDSPVLQANIRLSFEKVPDFTAGTKMFLFPRIYPIWTYNLPTVVRRTNDYYFSDPLISTDTTCYVLPAGYTVDNLPKGKAIESPILSYSSSFWYDPLKKAVFSSATLWLKTRDIPAKEYPRVKELFSRITEEEGEKIVINKQP